MKTDKVNLELAINEKTGDPIIKIRHHDKSNNLNQKVLKIFIDKAKCNGLEFRHTSGYIESGTTNSWENYEIRIRNRDFIYYWKPNLLQRFFYWIGIFKDPRYNGKRYFGAEIDEKMH